MKGIKERKKEDEVLKYERNHCLLNFNIPYTSYFVTSVVL